MTADVCTAPPLPSAGLHRSGREGERKRRGERGRKGEEERKERRRQDISM